MTLSIAEQYRQRQRENAESREIVDVLLPSQLVFKFVKPSKYTMVFRYGRLPQTAANSAVTKWIEQGIIKPGDFTEDQQKNIAEGLQLRDRVLELSYEPKLVVGVADETKGEMSTDDLSDDDADYLMRWVAAGGDVSLMLDTFPSGRGSGIVVSPNRKKRRASRK